MDSEGEEKEKVPWLYNSKVGGLYVFFFFFLRKDLLNLVLVKFFKTHFFIELFFKKGYLSCHRL